MTLWYVLSALAVAAALLHALAFRRLHRHHRRLHLNDLALTAQGCKIAEHTKTLRRLIEDDEDKAPGIVDDLYESRGQMSVQMVKLTHRIEALEAKAL